MAGRASKSDVKKSGSQNNTWEIVAVVQTGGVRVALLLDEVLGEQEVLLKSFEKPLVRVRHFAGATVLGSGRVAPILNVADVIQSATQNLTRAVSTAQAHSGQETRVQRILVADDSITSRMLIKNILEAAGFQTQTAVDGADALTELRAGEFDLLVSDVDMPHLTGFGLAAAVRADARLADLPIILVTGRETRDDRERGIEVGANAYLVKSSFDQTNLLEVVRRFI